MIYEPLVKTKENGNKCRYCVYSIIVTMTFSTSVFTFLTYQYLKAIAEGIENSNINEVVGIFEELRDCIEASGVCQK